MFPTGVAGGPAGSDRRSDELLDHQPRRRDQPCPLGIAAPAGARRSARQALLPRCTDDCRGVAPSFETYAWFGLAVAPRACRTLSSSAGRKPSRPPSTIRRWPEAARQRHGARRSLVRRLTPTKARWTRTGATIARSSAPRTSGQSDGRRRTSRFRRRVSASSRCDGGRERPLRDAAPARRGFRGRRRADDGPCRPPGSRRPYRCRLVRRIWRPGAARTRRRMQGAADGLVMGTARVEGPCGRRRVLRITLFMPVPRAPTTTPRSAGCSATPCRTGCR